MTIKKVKSSNSLTANFASERYVVTFGAGAHGSTIVTTKQTVDYGGITTEVTAVADSKYRFVNWTDSSNTVVGTSPVLTLTNVTAAQRRANFGK